MSVYLKFAHCITDTCNDSHLRLVCWIFWVLESLLLKTWTQRDSLFPWKQMMLPIQRCKHYWEEDWAYRSVIERRSPSSQGFAWTFLLMILQTAKQSILIFQIFAVKQKHWNTETPLPVDWADAGNVAWVTHLLQHQAVSDLPGKHRGTVVLQLQDLLHHCGGRHLGLGSTYQPRSDASCLIVPGMIESRVWQGKVDTYSHKDKQAICWLPTFTLSSFSLHGWDEISVIYQTLHATTFGSGYQGFLLY